MTRRIAEGLRVLGAFLIPLGVSALWVPVRTRLPNADLALILVLVVLAVGAAGHRLAVLAAAGSAAFWFDFFATRPFEHPSISRTPDLETTLVLALVALIGGEMAIRIVRHRSRARSDAARLTSISGAASLLASGEELALVVAAVGKELKKLLALRACTFEVAPANPARARIRRDGEVVPPAGRSLADARSFDQVEMPVWGHRHVFGQFVLEFDPDAPRPGRGDLVAAVALGDQVGAAFMTQAPTPPTPAEEPTPSLRVVR
jgi:K+-sensing histidine kinase KdpD